MVGDITSERWAELSRDDGRDHSGIAGEIDRNPQAVWWPPPLRLMMICRGKALGRIAGLPTVVEFMPGYEGAGWGGIGAPTNTPAEIVDKLNKEINAGLADHKIKARIADLGSVPMPMTPVDFAKFIAAEIDKWAKVIKFAAIEPP